MVADRAEHHTCPNASAERIGRALRTEDQAAGLRALTDMAASESPHSAGQPQSPVPSHSVTRQFQNSPLYQDSQPPQIPHHNGSRTSGNPPYDVSSQRSDGPPRFPRPSPSPSGAPHP